MKDEAVSRNLDAIEDDARNDSERSVLLRKIRDAELQISCGDIVEHEEAKKRLRRWLE